MSFRRSLRERAAATGRRVGFPEATEERTARAMRKLAEEEWVRPVAVVPEADGGAALPAGIERSWISPEEAADDGGPEAALRSAVRLLSEGRLDGVVAGATSETAAVVRAGLQILGVAPGIDTVSSSFYMVLREPTPAGHEVLTFTDAGVVPSPGPEQLADIARAACRARRLVVGDEPRVAFLSYSTHGSAGGEGVERVQEAAHLFAQMEPAVASDGELQADAALVPDVARRKAPGSEVAGDANVLVFPDLAAGNIAYKLVERLAGAGALGPVLQGLSRPLNDVSRGTDVETIVDVACITALMAAAGDREGARGESG